MAGTICLPPRPSLCQRRAPAERGELRASFRPSHDTRSQTTVAGQAGPRSAHRPGRLPGQAPAPDPARPGPASAHRTERRPRPPSLRDGGQQDNGRCRPAGPRDPCTAARPSTEAPALPRGGGRARCPAQASGPVSHMAAAPAAAQASSPAPPESGGRRVSPRRPTWLRPGAERRGAGDGRSGGR